MPNTVPNDKAKDARTEVQNGESMNTVAINSKAETAAIKNRSIFMSIFLNRFIIFEEPIAKIFKKTDKEKIRACAALLEGGILGILASYIAEYLIGI